MKRLTAPVVLALLASCATSEPGPPLPNSTGAPPSAAEVKGAAEKGLTAKVGEEEASIRPAAVDRSQKLETVDLSIDPSDPEDQRRLAPYLLRAVEGEWMLVKFEYRSPTQRYYRFQRVARTDGRSLPEVDPLIPPK